MTLAQSFRKAIEKVDLGNINSKQFWNIVQDCINLDKAFSFLWNIMIQQGIINDFLKLADSDEDVNNFIIKISYNTGLDLVKLQYLLNAFRVGVISAFYGAYPIKNTNNILKSIYENNKDLWLKRLNELHDGIIIAQKEGKYGVLSVKGEILPFKYRGATGFYNGIGCFNDGNKTGFINIMGNLEIDMEPIKEQMPIISISSFSEGFSKLSCPDHKIAYFSISGEFTDCVYDNTFSSLFWDNCLIISENGLKGIMNSKCEIVIEPQFKEIIGVNELDNDFIFAVNENREWFIIHKNRTMKKTLFRNPKYLGNGIIQDIFVLENKAQYEYYDESLQRIIDFKIDNVTCPNLKPILVHGNNGLYYFLFKKGIMANPNGYEFAFPFTADYTWVKVGTEWHRIDKLGNILSLMKDGEVLSKVNNGRILRRNFSSSLIEVFNCDENSVEMVIPNSKTAMITELLGRCTPINSYVFSIGHKYYLWAEGRLLSSDSPFKRNGYLYSCLNDGNSIRIIHKGKDFGIFNMLNPNDKPKSMFRLFNQDEIIVFETIDGQEYMYNITSNVYSDCYPSIFTFQLKYEDSKAIIAVDLDDNYILLNSEFIVVAKGDFISTTPNNNYFEIHNHNKYGLILYDGSTVIEEIYDYLNFFDSLV